MAKEDVSDTLMKSALSDQEAALHEGLHVAAAIGDKQDIYGIVHDPVDDPVGFKEYFAVIAYPQRQQLFWMGVAFWRRGQGGESLFDLR